jgi:GntR family transcriptional regulator/MocR family aminotransferase
MGYSHLREAISSYLIRARSVKSTPENIAIFSGVQSALDLVCRLLIDPGDTVVLENPGSPFARRSLKLFGAKILPLRIDSDGPVVADLEAIEEKVKLVYITPSHQDPTGVIMSVPRRLELLAWAQRTGALIIEDDYDSEYNYYGESPVPALHGMDDNGVVIYQSSFWKVLFPIVRIGFLVLPARLLEPVRQAKGSIERDLPLLEHVALTEFINQGMLERQIKRLRNLYARRRAALSHVLTRRCKEYATIPGVSGGMHMLINFDKRFQIEEIIACAKAAAVPMVSTEAYYLASHQPHEFMIDFAHSTEEQLTIVIDQFADLLTGTLSPQPSSTLLT